jgi:hypothetical protein
VRVLVSPRGVVTEVWDAERRVFAPDLAVIGAEIIGQEALNFYLT